MIGETLSHYEIVGKIFAGGMSEVYRARDPLITRHWGATDHNVPTSDTIVSNNDHYWTHLFGPCIGTRFNDRAFLFSLPEGGMRFKTQTAVYATTLSSDCNSCRNRSRAVRTARL